MNKIVSKEIFLKNKILTPKYFTITQKQVNFKNLKKKLLNKSFYFPVVLKPIDEGSSLGVKISKNMNSLYKSAKLLFKKYEKLIIEEFISGQEIQVAVINNAPLGAIELIPKRAFYDYKAKYTKSAKTKHIMPARLKKNKYLEVLR